MCFVTLVQLVFMTLFLGLGKTKWLACDSNARQCGISILNFPFAPIVLNPCVLLYSVQCTVGESDPSSLLWFIEKMTESA